MGDTDAILDFMCLNIGTKVLYNIGHAVSSKSRCYR